MKRLGLEYKNTLMIPMFENSSQREKNKITIIINYISVKDQDKHTSYVLDHIKNIVHD